MCNTRKKYDLTKLKMCGMVYEIIRYTNIKYISTKIHINGWIKVRKKSR